MFDAFKQGDLSGTWYMIARKKSLLAGDFALSFRTLRNTVVHFTHDTSGLYWSIAFNAILVFKYKFLQYFRFLFGTDKYHIPLDLKAIGPKSGYAYPIHRKKVPTFAKLASAFLYKKLFSSGRANFFIVGTYSSSSGARFFIASDKPSGKGSVVTWLCTTANPSEAGELEKECFQKAVEEFKKYVSPNQIEYPWNKDFVGR